MTWVNSECYVGNTIFAELATQGCDSPCAGAPAEICGGNSRINIYQDSTWQPPSLANLQTRLTQWENDLDNIQQAASQWYNLVLDAAQNGGAGSTSAVEAAYTTLRNRRQSSREFCLKSSLYHRTNIILIWQNH
jgi:hypothetical protein